jgi:hypothetical protein
LTYSLLLDPPAHPAKSTTPSNRSNGPKLLRLKLFVVRVSKIIKAFLAVYRSPGLITRPNHYR